MLDVLRAGVQAGGPVGALRVRASYQPVAGEGAKIAPPTYPDAGYLFEKRYIGGKKRKIVLVDSVQSQANRAEEALLEAVEAGLVAVPHLVTEADIDGTPFRVTSMDAPHRNVDAYFRDSQTADGEAFDDSAIGMALRKADERNARALYQHSPLDLVLGVWDSQRGGRGLRLPRAMTSEMIGRSPLLGQRAAGRLDPYNIPSTQVVYDKDDRSTWGLDKGDLPKGAKASNGKTSEINHGNALAGDAPGGVAVKSIDRLGVISLKVLRRLRFPNGDQRSHDADVAARTAIAALAILADRLAFADSALFLRSGCDLVRVEETAEWVGAAGVEPVELPDITGAVSLFDDAVAAAAEDGLVFGDVITLEPKDNLRSLLELTFSRAPEDD